MVSAAQEARIKFPNVFTTFGWNLATYDADHFDFSLQLVSGHVALWGFHFALMHAIVQRGMASVAVLVQAALCAPIEGVIVENEEKLHEAASQAETNVDNVVAWQQHGNGMATARRTHGKCMANAWQQHGKCMANA